MNARTRPILLFAHAAALGGFQISQGQSRAPAVMLDADGLEGEWHAQKSWRFVLRYHGEERSPDHRRGGGAKMRVLFPGQMLLPRDARRRA